MNRLLLIAARLERQGRTAESLALRAVVAQYGAVSLTNLITLLTGATQAPASAQRVQQLDLLMTAWDAAQSVTQAPASAIAPQLAAATQAGQAAAVDMLTAQGLVTAAFSVRPDAQIEYTQHAAARLARYWGTEQTRLRTEVQSALLEGLERGQSVEQITARLRERVQVSRSRARLVVANELGNAAAYAQEQTQTDLGVTEYIWRSASDDRVRDEHRARNGKTYRWDSPPPGGPPGAAIRCRCVALPIIPTT